MSLRAKRSEVRQSRTPPTPSTPLPKAKKTIPHNSPFEGGARGMFALTPSPQYGSSTPIYRTEVPTCNTTFFSKPIISWAATPPLQPSRFYPKIAVYYFDHSYTSPPLTVMIPPIDRSPPLHPEPRMHTNQHE